MWDGFKMNDSPTLIIENLKQYVPFTDYVSYVWTTISAVTQ